MMGQFIQHDSSARAREAMRKRAKREDAAGYKRVTLALSPDAVRTLQSYMEANGCTSRQAALNAMLERIGDDLFMRQELLAVST